MILVADFIGRGCNLPQIWTFNFTRWYNNVLNVRRVVGNLMLFPAVKERWISV